MHKLKVVIVIPAFNVAHVLGKTIAELSGQTYDEIILVDDGSLDNTAQIGRQLGLTVLIHLQNKGYGAAQKTGYKKALQLGADVVVLLHGDNQYDPSLVHVFVDKIRKEGFDLVTGTRMVLGDALSNGMPLWKFIPNRWGTWLENVVFGTNLSDYHNGFRAYSGDFLSQLPLELMSDQFDFDTDIIIQGVIRKCRIAQVPHLTRYRKENSQMPFYKGLYYAAGILRTIVRYSLHKTGICRQQIFYKSNLD